MKNMSMANFQENIYEMLDIVIKQNESLNLSTPNGNVVVISEHDYRSLMETLYIESIPELKKRLIESLNAPDEEFISEDEIEW